MANIKLTTRSDSPSTASYTVSTSPVRTSRLAQTAAHLVIVLRVAAVIVCWTVLILQCKRALGISSAPYGIDVSKYEATWAAYVSRNAGYEFAAGGKHWWVIPTLCATVLWLVLKRNYVEESLLLIRGLGIQTSSSSASYLSGPVTRFIPTSQIQDIFIHEAFIGFEVKFYLAVIVKGEDKAVVVFPKLLPRRQILEQVWRGARAVLGWGEDLTAPVP